MTITDRMNVRRLAGAACAAILFVGLAACGSDDETNADGLAEVTMIQDWPTPWVGWIPWVVADEQGYFEHEGISIDIQAPATVSDPVKFISTGRADVAFTTSLDLVLAQDQGASVRAIGAVTQVNNWGLITEGTETDVADLAGKKIAIYQDAWTKAQLETMLESAGLSTDDVTLVTAPSDTAPLLMAGKADVATGITNAEMTEVQVAGKDAKMALATDHGVPDIYVQALAASDDWLSENADIAAGFMAAVDRGTHYALEHPEEALAIFEKRYPDALDPAYAKASWDNTIPLFTSDDTKANGLYWSNESRWQDLVDFTAEVGLTEKEIDAADLYTNDYLEAN